MSRVLRRALNVLLLSMARLWRWAQGRRATPSLQGTASPIRCARLAKALYMQVRMQQLPEQALVETYARMVSPSFDVAKLVVARWCAMSRGERARAARRMRNQVLRTASEQGANSLKPLSVDEQTYTSDSAELGDPESQNIHKGFDCQSALARHPGAPVKSTGVLE
jgi:hypothetical protein